MSLQTDLDNLTAAINSGARTVSHNGKTVTYGTLAEMQALQNRLRAELANGLAAKPQSHYVQFAGTRTRR